MMHLYSNPSSFCDNLLIIFRNLSFELALGDLPIVPSLSFAGGQSSLADYCTYFVAYSDGSCTDTNSARAPDGMLGEVRGSNSR